MEELKEDVLELYGEGALIEDIVEELNTSTSDVLEVLRSYRKEQKVKGVYTDELMKMIARRDCRNIQRKKIMEELDISRSLLIKAIEKYGFLDSVKKLDTEQFIKEIPENFEFIECPICQSKKINEIDTLYNEITVKGVYCLDCGNEAFKHRGNLYKVKWENID